MKYHVYPKLVKDLKRSLSPNILPNMQDYLVKSPHSIDLITHNMSDSAVKLQCSHTVTDQLQPRPWSIQDSTHTYNLNLWNSMTYNK